VETDYVLEKLLDVSGPGLVECAEKTSWSVGTDYVLEKLLDVSGSGLMEAGRYNSEQTGLSPLHYIVQAVFRSIKL